MSGSVTTKSVYYCTSTLTKVKSPKAVQPRAYPYVTGLQSKKLSHKTVSATCSRREQERLQQSSKEKMPEAPKGQAESAEEVRPTLSAP